jgi:hypothetical protein
MASSSQNLAPPDDFGISQYSENWADSVQESYEQYEEPTLVQPAPTLGAAIDAYRQLSDPDKLLFQKIFDLTSKRTGSYAGVTEHTSVLQGIPAQSVPPAQAIQPQPVYQVLPSTLTRDPKTGKVFKIVPPKERSPAFIRLQRTFDAARNALATYCRTQSYVYDIESKQTRGPENRVITDDNHLTQLTDELKAAKAALNQYKTDHRNDEFAPPATKPVSVPVVGRGRGNPASRGRGI